MTTTDQPLDEAAQTALSAAEQPDTAQQPTPGENGAQGGADEPQEPEQRDERPGSEAARYRRRLRTVEAERDALVAERDRLREALLAAAVTTEGVDVPHDRYPASTRRLQLKDAADLERFGVLDGVTVWGDDGVLDRDALGQALSDLHRQRPELFARPEPVPGIGNTPLTARQPGGTWEAAFTPRSRR